MANSLPFDAVLVDGQYDRAYKAEDWAWYFATFLASGVFPRPSDGLQVVAQNGMKIRVNAGCAFINGYGFRNPASKEITLATAEGAQNRIDRVVVRWDLPRRDIYITVLKGTPSARPAAAAITRTAETWELALADIYVGKGVTRIQPQNITDQRFNSTVCGIVKGTVEEIDASTLTKQFDDFFRHYQAQVESAYCDYANGMSNYIGELQVTWDRWFTSVKDVLADAGNGELLSEVIRLYEDLYRRATESDIDKIINSSYADEDEASSIFEAATNEDIDNIIGNIFVEGPEETEGATEESIKEIVNNAFKQ